MYCVCPLLLCDRIWLKALAEGPMALALASKVLAMRFWPWLHHCLHVPPQLSVYATYINTRPINGCSATLIKWPHHGIYALGQLTRQASVLTHEKKGHMSSRIVNSEVSVLLLFGETWVGNCTPEHSAVWYYSSTSLTGWFYFVFCLYCVGHLTNVHWKKKPVQVTTS